jgi:hypothetical protein
MLLLPGSLTADHATLKALRQGLPEHSEIAQWLLASGAEAFDGTWGDAERTANSRALEAKESTGTTIGAASPLHASLGLSDLTPLDPSQLQLSDDESRALCEASDALMREEGVRVEFVNALQWQVRCDREIEALTERPEWIIGESLRPNLPRGRDARRIERWMNELQMLLFNHPVNQARAARGSPVVNMIWLWGFSQPFLDESSFDGRMLVAFRNGDLPSWQRAWGELSSRILQCEALILGDSRPRLKLTKRPVAFSSRLRWVFAAPRLSDALPLLLHRTN